MILPNEIARELRLKRFGVSQGGVTTLVRIDEHLRKREADWLLIVLLTLFKPSL